MEIVTQVPHVNGAGNQPFTWYTCVKTSACFTYRIYPF